MRTFRRLSSCFIKNDKERVVVTCAAAGCQWRVHVSREDNLSLFRIKTTQRVHTCGEGIGTTSLSKASKKLVNRQVIQTLRVVDIQQDGCYSIDPSCESAL